MKKLKIEIKGHKKYVQVLKSEQMGWLKLKYVTVYAQIVLNNYMEKKLWGRERPLFLRGDEQIFPYKMQGGKTNETKTKLLKNSIFQIEIPFTLNI